jgi:phenylacetate-coenzyme A ligase PaaK-like adenylate-forming protein
MRFLRAFWLAVGFVFALIKVKWNSCLFGSRLTRYQNRKLRKLLRYAVSKSDFYRDLYKNIDIGTCQLKDLPVTTKEMLDDAFDRVVTDKRLKRQIIERKLQGEGDILGFYLGRYKLYKTSGSEGKPAIFAYDKPATFYGLACNVIRSTLKWKTLGFYFKLLLRILVRKPYCIATIVTIGRYNATVSNVSALPGWVLKNLVLPVTMPVNEMVEQLNTAQPIVLVGYSAIMEILAYEQLEGRLCIHPKEIKCGGEPLSGKGRQMINKAFGGCLMEVYSTTESLALASECYAHDGMHIHEDAVILEVVDEHGMPVPEGVLGSKVLLTNLLNRVEPIIRYEISDMLSCIREDSCPCGLRFRKIPRVQGRSMDILWIQRKNKTLEPLHPFCFYDFLEDIPKLKRYQVVQTSPKSLLIYLIPIGAEHTESLRVIVDKELQAMLRQKHLLGEVSYTLEIVQDIPREQKSLKFKPIISLGHATGPL